VLAARLLYSLTFILAVPGHFTAAEVAQAQQQGVPLPTLLVPLSGLLALAGGLSILLGYRAKLGAWLLILFLVPVSLAMHNFWAVRDPMMAQIHLIMLVKNVGLLGGALLISQFGAGPLSFDAAQAVPD
jgi:putative oxidoreductase